MDGSLEELPESMKNHQESCKKCAALAQDFARIRESINIHHHPSLTPEGGHFISKNVLAAIGRKSGIYQGIDAHVHSKRPLQLHWRRVGFAAACAILVVAALMHFPGDKQEDLYINFDEELNVLVDEHILEMESTLFEAEPVRPVFVSINSRGN